MQTSEHYKLKIPEARDGLFKMVELYKELFHAIDALIYDSRFIGVEFSHEMRSKLNNIQYTSLTALEVAVINLQEGYQALAKLFEDISRESGNIYGLLEDLDIILSGHTQDIGDINATLAAAGAVETLDAITGLINMLNGNAGDIMAALMAKAEASDVSDLKERMDKLEYQVGQFDRFGIITDESNGSEYYITASNGVITLKETDKTLANRAILALDIPGADNITANILLPIDMMGCEISWVSHNPEIVLYNGIVNRSAYGEAPADVTLTAIITKGLFSGSKDLEVHIMPITTYEQLIIDMSGLTLPPEPIMGSISLPASIGAVFLTWASSDESFILPTGELVKRPAAHELDKSVILTAIGELEGEVRTKPFPLVILKQ